MSQAQQLAWMRDHTVGVRTDQGRGRGGRFVPVGGCGWSRTRTCPAARRWPAVRARQSGSSSTSSGSRRARCGCRDSFGYSAALPQLVRQSASEWFLTQKISGAGRTASPHHTFGGRASTAPGVHALPAVDTYNSEFSGREMAHAASNFSEKGGATRSLVPFGYGDGGGGPTREMLAARPGWPTWRLPSAHDRSRQQPSSQGRRRTRTPGWVGELYLEFHRGTYTSQARTKQGNRRSEHCCARPSCGRRRRPCGHGVASRTSGWTGSGGRAAQPVPRHPAGSSISWVHRDAERTYAGAGGRARRDHRHRPRRR